MKAYQFTMTRDNVTIETFVYSENGKDIENRFPEWKVTGIKEIPDPGFTTTNKEKGLT